MGVSNAAFLSLCGAVRSYKADPLEPACLSQGVKERFVSRRLGWLQHAPSTAKPPNADGKQIFLLLGRLFHVIFVSCVQDKERGEVCYSVLGGFRSLQSLHVRFGKGI